MGNIHVRYATPGTGGANSMGLKGTNVGIWAQAGRNIKAGTAVKPTLRLVETEELNAHYGSINALPAFHGEKVAA